MDELENVLFYLTDVVYRIVPPFSEELEQSVQRTFKLDLPRPARPVVRFGSWVGGDMDGNPNVSAETLRAALVRQRELLLDRYRREALELARRLSQSGSRAGVSEEVRRAHAAMRTNSLALAAIPARYHEMPYRVFFGLVAARLEAARRRRSGGTLAPELESDLRVVIASLREHRGACGLFGVERLLRRVETFGFHLVTIDVRQHAQVHRAALATLLRDPEWSSRTPADRVARLRQVLERGDAPAAVPDVEARRTPDVFQAIAESRERFGSGAVGPYIISMAHGVDDVLAVLVLARWAGLATPPADHVPLDIAPLFETVADLERAPDVMRALFADPQYRAHLARRGMRQVVMIGYSDSNKDAGIGAARWAYTGRRRTRSTADAAGVDITFFHGAVEP
jgi:phosphoenolpyruvate carboxylase